MEGVYHEKQSKAFCALHALNNLVQKKEYTVESLNEICENLSPHTWLNPHRSWIGLGNYDVNVIIKALEHVQLELVWFDKRKAASNIDLKMPIGFILNVPSDSKFGQFFKRKHWICIRKINEQFVNLDSKLDTPKIIGNETDLLHYLEHDVLNSPEKELFLVIKNGESWTRKTSNGSNDSGIQIENFGNLNIVEVDEQ